MDVEEEMPRGIDGRMEVVVRSVIHPIRHELTVRSIDSFPVPAGVQIDLVSARASLPMDMDFLSRTEHRAQDRQTFGVDIAGLDFCNRRLQT